MWKGFVTSVFRYEKVIFEAENEGNFLPRKGVSNGGEMRETSIDMRGNAILEAKITDDECVREK